MDMDKKFLDEDKCDDSLSIEIVRQIEQEEDLMIKQLRFLLIIKMENYVYWILN